MTEHGHLSQEEVFSSQTNLVEIVASLKSVALQFFSRLTKLFDSRRAAKHGSVFLTQKRLSPPNKPNQVTDTLAPDPELPLPILIRATDGKSNEEKKDKIKISTVVQPDEVEAFFVRYAEVCKAGMSGLKKRDRSGRKAKDKKRKRKGKGDEGEKKG